MLMQINQRLYLLSQLKLQLARLKYSGAAHIIHRSYDLQDLIRIACICRPTYR